MIRSIILAAIVSSTAFAGIAHAADDTVVETFVSTRGVDFNQPAQTQHFYKTLRVAAEKVCDVPGDNFQTRADNEDCQAHAIADAVRDTNSPQLVRYHEQALAQRDGNKVTQTASRSW